MAESEIKPLKNDSSRKESIAQPIAVTVNKTVDRVEVKRQASKTLVGDITISRRQAKTTERPPIKTIQKTKRQKTRSKTLSVSSHSDHFDLFDSWVSFNSDFDGDGYFSEFSLSFDADTSESFADVYAEIWLSLEGGNWVYLYATDDFTIYGDDSSDYYSLDFTLNTEYPTGSYDVLIDLYQVGYSDIVATIDSDLDSDLFALPLEDMEHELDSDNTLITYVVSELFNDSDHDGYYTQAILEFDINTYDAGRTVYAEVDIIDTVTLDRVIVSTDDFILGSHTEIIDIDFASGYVASYYDFEIRLIDVLTDEVIAYAGQDFSSLNQLPIESEEYDNSDVSVDVHISGGGSLGGGALLSGLLVLYYRKLKMN